MFDPAKILRPLLGGLAGLMQRKICLVGPFLYSVRCTCSFQLSFMWYPQCLIQPIIGALIWGSRGHPQQGVPGRHPYLIMVGYTIYVPVLRYWYLVRLTKMLWAAALYGRGRNCACHKSQKSDEWCHKQRQMCGTCDLKQGQEASQSFSLENQSCDIPWFCRNNHLYF